MITLLQALLQACTVNSLLFYLQLKNILCFFFSAESWGLWQPWSVCSVSCGEGVRERVRECLLPSGVGGMQCTGMVKEQSVCSLEDCAGQSLHLLFFFFNSLCSLILILNTTSSPFIPSVACTFSIPSRCACRGRAPWWKHGCGGWHLPLPGCDSGYCCGDCVEEALPHPSVQLRPPRVHAFPWRTQALG